MPHPAFVHLVVSLIFIFFGVVCALVAFCVRTRSVGLVAAFCFQMWLFYWVGALLHALPWAALGENDVVFEGFQMATCATVAFAAGVLITGPPLSKFILNAFRSQQFAELDVPVPKSYIAIGAFAYFVLAPTIGKVAGLQAIPAAASQLVVAGCCLQCWLAWSTKGRAAMLRGLALCALIPIVILTAQGFMSYGVMALSMILLFIAHFFRPRWVVPLVAVGLVWPGLSVFASYMRDRFEIRSAVWVGDEIAERLGRIWSTATNIEAFNPVDEEQLRRVDERLNQNVLVGEAIENLSYSGEFLHGASIRTAVLALVPRLLWPNKPAAGGSGDLVARLTGRQFAAGTSIGVGPVLELYGNFGTPGVVLGFLLLGGLVRALDICAAEMLRLGNWGLFTIFFLIGISCINVSGSLVEVTASSAASLLVGIAVRPVARSRATMQRAEATA